MTLRGGGRPRELGDQAHRIGPEPVDLAGGGSPDQPRPAPRTAGPLARRGNGGGPPRGAAARYGSRPAGGHHLLRFLAFALVLAAVVLAALGLVLRPLLSRSITDWAAENPTALRLPFVADIVRGELGPRLTDPATSDPRTVKFLVELGDSPEAIATRLQSGGLLRDQRAFVFLAITEDVTSQFQAGTYFLRANMTPDQLVAALTQPPPDPTIRIGIREGLRLEQITALLEKLEAQPPDPSKPLTMDVKAFYQLAEHPTPALLAAHPWLRLPKDASLEGFLAPATYTVLPDISPGDFLGQMLEHFHQQVGDTLAPGPGGLDAYGVLSLASIVELETTVDAERAEIAGVYVNRLARAMLLNADPTVLYARDSAALASQPLPSWVQYSFWEVPSGGLANVQVPADLAGYQTYQHTGMIPGPICTPTLASIQAVLQADTKSGYLYFVAKGDGSGTHAFARTAAEFQALLRKYGYAP